MDERAVGAISVTWAVMTATALVAPLALPKSLTAHGKQREADLGYSGPKSWFSHFYIVALASAVTLHYFDLGWLTFTLHSLRRLLEQSWLFPSRSGSRMHVLAYLLGLAFYPLLAVSFWGANRQQSWPWWCWLLFSLFSLSQFLSHRHLYHLRVAGQGEYSLPTAFPFRLILCPHYLAEVLIYCLWSLEPGGLCLQMCAVFVAVSLAMNALNQRKWYQSHFKSVPRAIFPLVL